MNRDRIARRGNAPALHRLAAVLNALEIVGPPHQVFLLGPRATAIAPARCVGVGHVQKAHLERRETRERERERDERQETRERERERERGEREVKKEKRMNIG